MPAAWYGSKMERGIQFRYDYTSISVNTIAGLSEDRSGLRFRMTVVFTIIDDCWLLVKVGWTMGLNTLGGIEIKIHYAAAA